MRSGAAEEKGLANQEGVESLEDYAKPGATQDQELEAYFLRCRIRARMRRFLLPIFRRPLPVRFVPTRKILLWLSVCKYMEI
jgi:hypothetical protein